MEPEAEPPSEVERLEELPAVSEEGLAESETERVGGDFTLTVKLYVGLPVAP